MNYNELYRPKDRLRPKRSPEEKRNIGKILLAGAAGLLFGLVIMAAILRLFFV